MTNSADIKALIREQLPSILAEDSSIRDFILRTVSDYYSPKQETDQKFEEFKERVDRILDQLERDREEQARKWDENTHKWDENTRKWDRILDQLERDREEQARKWDENNRRLDNFIHEQNQKWNQQYQQNQETLEEIKKMNRQYDSTIGALGSRWGLFSEASFRNALAGILKDSFGVEVVNINDYDPDGIVFGRPDQVEIDVIIKNGLVIVCEIKSSMSKSDIYTFGRKVEFYQQKYQRSVNRKIVISPMIAPNALPVAESLGIEVYSYADSVSI
ncbi:Protein of unknown function DUF1626 [Rippkaea orientalis PCC 8801]|uniref:DUF3782 domain-containing protein n=1 Tax=Rippkaea orientalis (strain PCC 8801 / RF-1) TaxID=41431 RepID=B7K672_RIPO1|nr:DUF3782 domain-containing protein [Rippkaea orientalis]ACK68125.1 Protein of unknown function DUF1626 [Rippkaea orientalis PCC 8801]